MLIPEVLDDNNNHKTREFVCEKEHNVAQYLQNEAIIYEMSNNGRTRLYFDDKDNLVGFFTLCNDLTKLVSNSKRKKRIGIFQMILKFVQH